CSTPTAVTPVRVLLSVVAVVAMLVVSLAVRQWIPYTQMTFFFAAVLVSARLGGFALGAFAVALSVAAAELVLFPPVGIAESELISGRILVWTAIALLIS